MRSSRGSRLAGPPAVASHALDECDDLVARDARVHREHEHVAGACPCERGAHGVDLRQAHGKRRLGVAAAEQCRAQDCRHLAGRAAAQEPFRFLDDHQIGARPRRGRGELLDVADLPVAGLTEQQPQPPGAAQVMRNLEQTAQTVRVVCVVHQQAHATHLVAHEPPRVVAHVRSEACVHRRDGRGGNPERERGERGAGEIRDVVGGAAVDRERHRSDRAEIVRLSAQPRHQPPVAHASACPALCAMRDEQRVVRVAREPAEGPPGRLRTRPQLRVIGVDHQQPVRADQIRHDELDLGERIEIVNAVFAEVIGAHVGDHGDARLADGQTAAENPAARGLEHRRLHAPVAQHRTSANRPRVIAGGDQRAVEKQTVRAVVPGAPAVRASTGGDQPHGRCLAVRAGDDGGRHVMEGRPADVGHGRQRVEGQVDVAVARTEREHLVVEDPWQIAPLSGVDQREQIAARLHLRQLLEPRHRRRIVQHRRDGGRRRGIGGLADHRGLETGPANGIACQQRRRQCPFVELGRGEELVHRRGDGEGRAVCMHARDRGLCSNGDCPHFRGKGQRPLPAEECPAALDPCAPVVDQRCIGFDADDIQHGARRIEEQVAAGETPRVVEGQ